MVENKSLKLPQDSSPSSSYEVEYWASQLGVSRERLMELAQKRKSQARKIGDAK